MNNLGVWTSLPSKLYAIGDLHGDFNVLQHVLIDLAKVADYKDKKFHWKGADSWLVFCGDLIDRHRRREGIPYTVDDENNDKNIINLLIDLDKKARVTNGRVILLLGNHELLNFEGAFNYVSEKGHYLGRVDDFTRGSEFAKKIADNFYLSAKIGNWIFVHGGFCPEAFENNTYLQQGNVIHKLNKATRLYLSELNFFDNPSIKQDDKDQVKILTNALYGINENKSPLNCRHYGSDVNIEECVTELETKVFKYLFKNPEKGKMAIAHTPQFISNLNINSTCNEKVWRLDVGMSRGFDEHIKMIERMIVKLGMNLIRQLRFIIGQDSHRYMSILEIQEKSEKVITEFKYSRNIKHQKQIENSEAIFTIYQLEMLKNKLNNNELILNSDIEYQKGEIINNIDQMILFLKEKHPKELKGGGKKKDIYLVTY
jgi:hypothetical protein